MYMRQIRKWIAAFFFFFESLKVYLHCERHVIFLGDFNCVCSSADRAKKPLTHDLSAMVLNSLVHEFGLEDVACVQSNMNAPQYTFST